MEYLPAILPIIFSTCVGQLLYHISKYSKKKCSNVYQYLRVHWDRAPTTSFKKFQLYIAIPTKIENLGHIFEISGLIFSSYSGNIHKSKIMTPQTCFDKFLLSIAITIKIENSDNIFEISGPTSSSYSEIFSKRKKKLMWQLDSILACLMEQWRPRNYSINSCCRLRSTLKSKILIIYSTFPGRLFHHIPE